MDAPHSKNLLFIQSLVLFGGTIFAWSKLLPQIDTFQTLYGTLFRFNDLAVPNPLLTACLYGSTAFLVVLFWSVLVVQRPGYGSQRMLRNALLFCVVFAASVVASEAVEYYKLFDSAISVTCSPGVPPTQTPCFYGMLFFIAAFITSVYATRRLK
jgi:hypothetical protein